MLNGAAMRIRFVHHLIVIVVVVELDGAFVTATRVTAAASMGGVHNHWCGVAMHGHCGRRCRCCGDRRCGCCYRRRRHRRCRCRRRRRCRRVSLFADRCDIGEVDDAITTIVFVIVGVIGVTEKIFGF